MKFGTEVVLKGGKVLGFFGPVPPTPAGTGCKKGVWGESGATGVHFGKNFINKSFSVPPI